MHAMSYIVTFIIIDIELNSMAQLICLDNAEHEQSDNHMC